MQLKCVHVPRLCVTYGRMWQTSANTEVNSDIYSSIPAKTS